MLCYLGGEWLVGRFTLPGSGVDGEVRRVRRNFIALLILSSAAAIILALTFRLGVPGTVLDLIVGGGAPASMYITWRQIAKSDDAGDTLANSPRALADSGLERLAKIVLKQWNKEYEHRTFNDPAPKYRDIRASWSVADASLAVGWDTLIELACGSAGYKELGPLKWAATSQGLSGLDEEDLRGILEKVPTGWLVVLGGSGSGKSMLMLRTVREIINHRKSGDPVPVFVPMTSWDPKKDSLRTWLEKQLLIDYPGLGASVTRGHKRTTLLAMLLDDQKILPILDGLDEMPVTAGVEAINQLNRAFSADARPLRLVVTCRTDYYRRAVLGEPKEKGWKPNPLVAAAAIELHNLDADKVSSYLARRGEDKRWTAVDDQLRQHGELARALNTPLYASLASEIYNPSRQEDRSKRRDPGELCTFAGEEAVHHHLLDEFIPAVYADAQAELYERAEEEYEEPKQLPAERWLMILADYLTRGRKEPATSLEWWDLRGLAPSLAVRVARHRRLLDQFAGYEMEGVPAIPREGGKVAGVARQHGRILVRWGEPAALAEPIDRRYFGGLGQAAEPCIAQRPRQATASSPLAPAPAQFADAPGAHRLDQRLHERRRGGLDLPGMTQVVRENIQLPERHHQAAAGQSQRLQSGVLGAEPFLVHTAWILPEFLQQRAVRANLLGLVSVTGPCCAASSQSPNVSGGEITEHGMLPGHIPLHHRQPARLHRVEDEWPAGDEGIGRSIRRMLLWQPCRCDGNLTRRARARGRLLDHVGNFVRQQPQTRARMQSERPISKVDIRAHGERPGVQCPAGRVGAGVVQPN